MKHALLLACLLLAGCGSSPDSAKDYATSEIAFRAWDQDQFAEATRDHKLVILDLGAVWCHWCHVMDKETYGDPEVQRIVNAHYIPVHVNQDERPDLAARYEDYGWPGTIIFRWDGTELAKFRGYIPPKRMASLLQSFVDDPTPGPSAVAYPETVAANEAALGAELRAGLETAWLAAYDREHAGWGTVHKYLDPDSVELAIASGRDDLARPTLDAMLGLIDPVWGGVYQYSDGGVWTNPHFEKIMSFQAEDLRIYALAYRVYGDERYLKAAKDIERYLRTWLRGPEGAFFASQDADVVQGKHSADYFALDDAGRRADGTPRVDTHVFTRENGWAIVGLASLYRSTGDASTLTAATVAAEWILRNRTRPGGGFRHDERDSGGPYLADSLAMARAFHELHQVTLDPAWHTRATETLAWIDTTFCAAAGFTTAAMPPGAIGKPWAPVPQIDENIAVARLALRLDGVEEGRRWKPMAEHAARLLAGEARSARGVRAAGLLLVDRELTSEPAILTLTGSDRALLEPSLATILRAPTSWICYRAVTPSPELTVQLCIDGTCLAPGTAEEALKALASRPRK